MCFHPDKDSRFLQYSWSSTFLVFLPFLEILTQSTRSLLNTRKKLSCRTFQVALSQTYPCYGFPLATWVSSHADSAMPLLQNKLVSSLPRFFSSTFWLYKAPGSMRRRSHWISQMHWWLCLCLDLVRSCFLLLASGRSMVSELFAIPFKFFLSKINSITIFHTLEFLDILFLLFGFPRNFDWVSISVVDDILYRFSKLV